MSLIVRDSGRRWINGVIPFKFDMSVNPALQSAIVQAQQAWEAVTPVRFVPQQNEADFVLYRNVPGVSRCSSPAGRKGGPHEIKCALKATTTDTLRALVHEIGHAIGLQHEHQRLDRDASMAVSKAAAAQRRQGLQSARRRADGGAVSSELGHALRVEHIHEPAAAHQDHAPPSTRLAQPKSAKRRRRRRREFHVRDRPGPHADRCAPTPRRAHGVVGSGRRRRHPRRMVERRVANLVSAPGTDLPAARASRRSRATPRPHGGLWRRHRRPAPRHLVGRPVARLVHARRAGDQRSAAGHAGAAAGVFSLAVRSRFTDHMEVWVIGADGQVHHTFWDGSSWQGWFCVCPVRCSRCAVRSLCTVATTTTWRSGRRPDRHASRQLVER